MQPGTVDTHEDGPGRQPASVADCRNGDRPTAMRRGERAGAAQAWEAPSNDIRMRAWESSNCAVARTAAWAVCPNTVT